MRSDPSNIESKVHPAHLADVRQSGLSDETIAQHGIYSVCPGEIKRIIGWDPPELKSLLAFPYPGCNGFTRFKLFPSLETKGGGTMRYFQEKGSGLHIYFPPGFDHSAEVIRISEGEKKSLEGTQEGLNVCGLGGIWNFALRDNNGNPQLIEDFQRLDFRSVRSIEIIPDGDFKQKEGVRHAVYRLAYLLGGEFYNKKGYESLSEAVDCIRVVELPLYFKLDDFLCEYGVRAFEGLPRITVADRIFDDIREKERKEVTRIDLQDSLIGLKTLLTMDIPGRPRLFLWLPQGGLAMVYGPRGIGKTYFSLSLAVSLATGKSFLRWAGCPIPRGWAWKPWALNWGQKGRSKRTGSCGPNSPTSFAPEMCKAAFSSPTPPACKRGSPPSTASFGPSSPSPPTTG